jgi:hypothetical protein
MCQNHTQAEEALDLVTAHLQNKLGLKLHPEKTHITTFKEGFSYLGFDLCARSVKMRAKSVEKFKIKVREITKRSYNLDAELITRLNQVVRGTANYFATPFSHNRQIFARLDQWIRSRLRSMKFKRKWKTDNWRMRIKHLLRYGLLSLRDFYPQPA